MAGFSLQEDLGQPAGKDLGTLAAATRCLLFAHPACGRWGRLVSSQPTLEPEKHLSHFQMARKFPAPEHSQRIEARSPERIAFSLRVPCLHTICALIAILG
jgi:hypothetical protein